MIDNKEDLLKQCVSILYSEQDKDEVSEFLCNIRDYCEATKDDLIFNLKEIEILKSTYDYFLLLDIIKDFQNDKKYSHKYNLKSLEKLSKIEVNEFKSKLERLMS